MEQIQSSDPIDPWFQESARSVPPNRRKRCGGLPPHLDTSSGADSPFRCELSAPVSTQETSGVPTEGGSRRGLRGRTHFAGTRRTSSGASSRSGSPSRDLGQGMPLGEASPLGEVNSIGTRVARPPSAWHCGRGDSLRSRPLSGPPAVWSADGHAAASNVPNPGGSPSRSGPPGNGS